MHALDRDEVRMLAVVPLTDDERTAVVDGQSSLDQLLDRLADVPTPAGPTPRQLGVRDTSANRRRPPRRTSPHYAMNLPTADATGSGQIES